MDAQQSDRYAGPGGAGVRRRIALIGGDGIGPEVIAEAKSLLEWLRDGEGLALDLLELDLGAERYLRDGATFPPEIREEIAARCDAVLLGALGDPRVPGMEHARDILFGLRLGFDLYANIRPVLALADRLVPLSGRKAADVQFVVFRENTEGAYAGLGGQFKKGTSDEVAVCEEIHTRKGVERIVRAAFDFASREGKRTVHMADKSNAIPQAHELWRRTFHEVSEEYGGITGVPMYIDALCYAIVRDPSQFEVIVTNNLFGDIVTDLGAALQGGLGMAASSNVHPGHTTDGKVRRPPLFEPVHGSAPDLAGKGVANPFAALLCVALLMGHLGFPQEEARIVSAVRMAVDEHACTPDIGGRMSTREAAARVRQIVATSARCDSQVVE